MSSKKRGITHIPAIDGLRAVAVIAVMLYHLGFSWIPGGFLGVDLFFVISGYVITRLLLDSIAQSGGLDLRGFYIARARRLLPALIFMLVSTTIAIGIWAPDTIKRLLIDTPFSLTGTMNWWLVAHHQDYFDTIGRPPLLQHTWSLAVEAQLSALAAHSLLYSQAIRQETYPLSISFDCSSIRNCIALCFFLTRCIKCIQSKPCLLWHRYSQHRTFPRCCASCELDSTKLHKDRFKESARFY